MTDVSHLPDLTIPRLSTPHNEHISHPRVPHLSKALQAAFLSRVGPHKQTQSAEPIKKLLKDVGGSLERWNQKWRRSLDGWWGAVPAGGVIERCGAFLSGVLASRFQSWIGRDRLSGGAVAPPPAPTNDAAGCEEALEESPLPEFPESVGEEERLPFWELPVVPIPRLLPSQLHAGVPLRWEEDEQMATAAGGGDGAGGLRKALWAGAGFSLSVLMSAFCGMAHARFGSSARLRVRRAST